MTPHASSAAPASDVPISVPSAAGERRRIELLDVAIDVFGRDGFAGGRIDDVARAVGIRRPSVLYHFPDKPTLYFAAITRVVEEVTRRISGAVPRDGDRLAAMVDAWVDFVLERPLAARLLLRQLVDGDPAENASNSIAPAVHRLLAVVQSALDERAGSSGLGPEKPRIDGAGFSLVLASASLVWVAGRSAVERTLGLDTLSTDAIASHRETLRSLTRQLLAAHRHEAPPGGTNPALVAPHVPAESKP